MALGLWQQRARQLQEESIACLRQVADLYLRGFRVRRSKDLVKPENGSFAHVCLWREMCEGSNCPDVMFQVSLIEGFPLIREMEKSHIWPLFDPVLPPLFCQRELQDRAWGIRQRLKLEQETGRSTLGKCGRPVWRM